MARIYFWDPADGQVGHCSLSLDDETYISFWPCEDYGKKQAYSKATVQSEAHTYASDKDDEKRPEDRTIKIRGKLNNQKIKTWWAQSQRSGYSVSNNCSTMVELALEVGELESNELRELKEILAQWRSDVAKVVTGGGVKHSKAMKRVNS